MEVNYEAMKRSETFVPEHMRGGYKLWIEHGISAGSFATALLQNNLKETFGRADHINKEHVGTTIAWFYSYAPMDCWGSVGAVKEWKGTDG